MDVARYYRRNAIGVVLVYAMVAAPQLLYALQASIPDQLNHVEGTLNVVRAARNDQLLSVDGDNDLLLTCASRYKGTTRCIPDKDVAAVVGRPAEATWFQLELLPFYYVNRLATLEVEGRVVVSLERTQRRIESGKKTSIWIWGGGTVFVLGISLMFWRMACAAERRKAASA